MSFKKNNFKSGNKNISKKLPKLKKVIEKSYSSIISMKSWKSKVEGFEAEWKCWKYRSFIESFQKAKRYSWHEWKFIFKCINAELGAWSIL